MKRSWLLFALIIASTTSVAQIFVTGLKTNNLTEPIGLDLDSTRFSWKIESTQRNAKQVAYQIVVSLKAEGGTPIWYSGKIQTDQSVFVPYRGAALQSNTQYFWRVRVWDNHGRKSNWSKTASWRTGLRPSDWKAKWIQPGYEEDQLHRASPVFRKVFEVRKKISSAFVYITAHGLYEAAFNDSHAGEDYFTPGWTSYHKRLQYQVYDVTRLIRQGKNVINVTLGSGWYRGYLGFNAKKDIYGKDVSLLLQLELIYQDGSRNQIITNEDWRSVQGPIVESEIYDGEIYDARKADARWMLPDFDDSQWPPVRTVDFGYDNLITSISEPVKKQETFHAVRSIVTPQGEHVIDFGQNITGWVQCKLKGKAGDTIRIYHAEVLDQQGNFYTANLGSIKATDTYILTDQEQWYEPHFTYHGFRYIKVVGFSERPEPDRFTAVALYSNLEKTGQFTSSNPLLNQLQHNIQWGQNDNFLDIPMDCPQRQERLGWTGDAQVFFRTASFNANVYNFFVKWYADLLTDQHPSGVVPWIVPDIYRFPLPSAGYGDAATIIPWQLYQSFGDKRALGLQYPGMKKWVDYVSSQTKNDLWQSGFHFGDWLFYSPSNDRDGRAAVTEKYLIAQCFYAHSTQLLIQAAEVLGFTADQERYKLLLQKIKKSFLREYVTPGGQLVSNTQTAYVLALHFDMLPEDMRPMMAEKLVQNIKKYAYHLTTGFLGTPYLCEVLSRFGYSEVAYKLVEQETFPSWLYPVTKGATTMWERWDGIKPDGTFQDPSMNSFNHYAYGAIGDWLYRTAAGIDTQTDGAGYKKIIVKPNPGGSLKFCEAKIETQYGRLSSLWEKERDHITIHITIPANTSADLYIPASSPIQVMVDRGVPIAQSKDLIIESYADGYLHLKAGSGTYQFESYLPPPKDSSKLASYVGLYYAKGRILDVLEVVEKNGELVLIVNGDELILQPDASSPDSFRGNLETLVQFNRNTEGDITSMKFQMMGMVATALKM